MLQLLIFIRLVLNGAENLSIFSEKQIALVFLEKHLLTS
jgi:hypothetical protein